MNKPQEQVLNRINRLRKKKGLKELKKEELQVSRIESYRE